MDIIDIQRSLRLLRSDLVLTTYTADFKRRLSYNDMIKRRYEQNVERNNLIKLLGIQERLACGIISRSAGLFQNNKKNCACDGVIIWDERNRPLAGPGRRQPQSSL